MKERALVQRIEKKAELFKSRAVKGLTDGKRHDLVKRDERETMWEAYDRLGWSNAKIAGVFNRDPRAVQDAIERHAEARRNAVHAGDDQGNSDKVVVLPQPYQPSPHKQKMLDLATSLRGEINSPQPARSFLYWSPNQLISFADTLGRVRVDGKGNVFIETSIDGTEELDDLHAGLRSHLETGGFAGLLADIRGWEAEFAEYLAKCHEFLGTATSRLGAKAKFRDDVARNAKPGLQRGFFVSACADAVDAAEQHVGDKPAAISYSEMAARNYYRQPLTNGFWLLMRYGFGGICVTRTKLQAARRLGEHRRLIAWLSEKKKPKRLRISGWILSR